MKVIELLNKIAKGEEVPKKIKYCGVYYYWTGCNYENSEADDVLFWAYIYSEKHLNDEIEIIEEDKKEDKKIEKLTYAFLTSTNQKLKVVKDKINEIIDKLNKEE